MISGKIRLRNYSDWQITYYIFTKKENASVILDSLYGLGCNNKFLQKAAGLLESGKRNIGITYSNSRSKRTVFVISETTSLEEFFNSLAHEVDHVEKHIAKALDFSPYSEQASYLVGEILQKIIHNTIKQVNTTILSLFGK